MAPDALVCMELAHSDYGPVQTALDRISVQVLVHPWQRRFANLGLHLAYGLRGKVPYHTPVAVEHFASIVDQPVADQ